MTTAHGTRRRSRLSAAIGTLLLATSVALLVHLPTRPLDARAPAPEQAWPKGTTTTGRTYYASPHGTGTNPGTLEQPLDLTTAISSKGPLRPGDVLWLKQGVYRGNFKSDLAGKPGAFIVVAAYPGERAVLDGGVTGPDLPVLRVDGAYTVYWGFEVTNSTPDQPGRSRGAGIDVFGAHTKFINLVVHDTGNGFGIWTPALEAELYGTVIYRSGWDEDDRGHGHSIYVQNDKFQKRLVDNILFDGHSFGVHAYTESGDINNLYLEGNIAFDHGTRSRVSGPKANILVGGYHVAEHPMLVSNYAYYPEGSVGRDADVGYIAGCADAGITRNYFAGGVPVLLTRCNGVDMKGNTFIGAVDSSLPSQFPENQYVHDRPRTSEVFVRPNHYQMGRGNVVVFNWERRPSVRVNLANLGLRPGEKFEVRDVRNYFGAPLTSGSYKESIINLPVVHMARSEANGPDAHPELAPEFGAAVVAPIRNGLSQGLPWATR